jgi:4-amino-4-deoxy-L-arabinose transferase-like glycosyltransferase
MEKRSYPKPYSRKYSLLFILIVFISCLLILISLKNIHFAGQADEGYYLKYASYIAKEGIMGFSDLFKDYLRNQENWVYPNPLRIGYIILSSIWVSLFGCSFLSLSFLSLFCFLSFLLTSFYFGRKYFGEKIALLFIVLLAFSPINMSMARRVLTESVLMLFSTLSIWLFLDMLKESSNLKKILFVFAFSFAILVKEVIILLVLVFMIFLVGRKLLLGKRIYFKDFLTILFIPFVIVILTYIFVGVFPFLAETVKIILNSPKTNLYAIQYGQGPWFRYLIDYILLSPWVVLLSIGFIFNYFNRTPISQNNRRVQHSMSGAIEKEASGVKPCNFISKEQDEIVLYLILVFILSFFIFNIFTKNIRYVMVLDMPMRLFSVLMLKNIFDKKFPKRTTILTATFIIVISVFDYIIFYNLFVKMGIYDPVTFILLKARQLIP